MWLFTKHGFYSATLSSTKRGHIQVRARCRADLERLIQALPDELSQSKIIETPAADYRWRIVMTPSKFTVCAMKLADGIDYHNFKNACYAAGLDTTPHHSVWHTMMRVQIEEQRAERQSFMSDALPGIREWADRGDADEDLGGPYPIADDEPIMPKRPAKAKNKNQKTR